jgi:hypothetical protein
LLAASKLQIAGLLTSLAVPCCALLAEKVADVEPEAAGKAAHQFCTDTVQAAVGVSQQVTGDIE